MQDKLLTETLLFALDRTRSVIADWVADYNAGQPSPALGYQTPAAYAAQLAAMWDRLHESETFRQSPIVLSAQAENRHPMVVASVE